MMVNSTTTGTTVKQKPPQQQPHQWLRQQQLLLLLLLLLVLFLISTSFLPLVCCSRQKSTPLAPSSQTLQSSAVINFPGLSDQVHHLPELNLTSFPNSQLPFRHFSGYLNSSTSSNFTSRLFYWFFESANATTRFTDPLVLWLNGGPGVSSLTGALLETGPFSMQANGTLTRNLYSWNANLLFIDTPVNVGFSYSTNSSANSSITTDDHQTAALNFAALQSFYQKFPHLLQNTFILAGQSYAGVYLPTLALHLIDSNFPPNFRAISLGNPLLDHRYVVHSPLQLGHDHGLINETLWRRLLTECNCGNGVHNSTSSTDAILSCPFLPLTWTSSSLPDLEPPSCDTLYQQIYLHLYKLAHNAYNYRQSCATREDTFICRTDRDEAAFRWLNRVDVQRALSVESNLSSSSGGENHNKNTGVLWMPFTERVRKRYQQNVRSVERHFRRLLARRIRFLLYFGELDLTCTYISGRWFLADLKLNQTTTMTNSTFSEPSLFSENERSKFSVQQYNEDGQLTFVRLKEAGHQAVRDQPALLQKIFHQFLESVLQD